MCFCVYNRYLALNLIFKDHGHSSESTVKYDEIRADKMREAHSVKVLSLDFYLCSILVILSEFRASFLYRQQGVNMYDHWYPSVHCVYMPVCISKCVNL